LGRRRSGQRDRAQQRTVRDAPQVELISRAAEYRSVGRVFKEVHADAGPQEIRARRRGFFIEKCHDLADHREGPRLTEGNAHTSTDCVLPLGLGT
jgi:hypothetical protein